MKALHTLMGTAHPQDWLSDLAGQLAAGQSQVLVTVGHTLGSAPQDAGARMCVGTDFIVNTIGGGHLEWKAIACAREMLAQAGPRRKVQRYPLGPGLGQCCGGVVWLVFEYLDSQDVHWCLEIGDALSRGRSVRRIVDLAPASDMHSSVVAGTHAGVALYPLSAHERRMETRLDIERGRLIDVWSVPTTDVVVCGAGHIGHAIVRLLADLPVRVVWLDPRDDCWPARVPVNVQLLQGDEDDVPDMPEQAYWLVLTHNHALDLAIVDSVFRHKSFAFMGLIGSKTKQVRFSSRLRQRHDAQLVERLCCPIGIVSTSSKQPAVIAVSVVAQLLELIAA